MVWISKREIAYYFILKQVFQERIFNLGEALDVLTLLGSKRTARKVIKMLVSRGLLEKVEVYSYKVKELEPALLRSVNAYIINRMYRRLKSLGLKVDLISSVGMEKIIVYGCDEKMREVISLLSNRFYLECS